MVEHNEDIETTTELDSHADQCVVGSNCLVTHDFETPVRVTGYDKGKSKTYRTISAALAYDDPMTGEVIILVINQAIFIPTIKHNLLCPMQLRLNDIEVDEKPKFLTDAPTEKTHAISIPSLDQDEPYVISLSIKGVTSYFPTRKPTKQEYEESEQRYVLTSDSPEWNPSESDYSALERSMTNTRGEVIDRPPKAKDTLSICELDRLANIPHDGDYVLDTHFPDALAANRNVSYVCSSKLKLDPLDTASFDRGLCGVSMEPSQALSPETLAKRWHISPALAKQTLKSTTQRGIRTVLHPTLSRRYRSNDRQLRYRRLNLTLFTDTMKASVKAAHGLFKYAQVFCARNGWIRAYPMKTKGQAHEALSQLFATEGVPSRMVMDNAREQIMGDFRQKCRQVDCHVSQTEPYTPWSNAAEAGIRELKKGFGRSMMKSKAPLRLWNHCLEWEAMIMSHTAHDLMDLQGEVPQTVVSGQTADISSLCQHSWYEWVKFRHTPASFPEDKMVLGRYLGPSFDVGPALTAKILKANGQIFHTSTYRGLTQDEVDSPEERSEREAFDKSVAEKLGNSVTDKDLDAEGLATPTYEKYEDDTDGTERPTPDVEDVVTPEEGDVYLNADVLLPRGDGMRTGRVRRRKRDSDGTLRGTANENPILDTRTYEVEFPDGEITEYAANVIAENMWSQCDLDGKQFLLLDSIIDYKSDGHAVKPADKYIIRNGRKHLRKTTKGWYLCVQWKDGTTTWERLADLKESNPIEVSEYAVAQGLDHEPAFCWWVPYTLRKRDRIIASVNSRFLKKNFKFGFEIPNTVGDAIRIDKANRNTLWMDAIRKEMATVAVAFEVVDGEYVIPPGYQEIKCHLVFTVKLENFKRKARYVAGGHTTDPPATLTYASVVSRDTVRIALTIAALNALEVKASDIEGAYLTAPVKEKIWTRLGPEWGDRAGQRAIVVRALYGLKSAGNSFRSHLADCMHNLGYKPCLADPDLWYKPMTREDDGFKYYAYILLYVDDCLCVHHDAEGQLLELNKFFKMKPGSIGDPDIYLGAKIKKTVLPNGVVAWGTSASQYVQEAVKNVEVHLAAKEGRKLKTKGATGPFPLNYSAELDVTPELTPDDATYYQSEIGVLRWMVELGRVDIITEVSTLASHMALPREGHLEALFHLFGYLKRKHNARLVLDPTYPDDIDEGDFKECDWREFYGDVKEAIPPDALEPRGKEVDLRLFVDSSHADDKLNRRSRSGYFIFMNMAPIMWLSKKQSTIETSVFGAEFVAMKIGVEALRGLRYKLRMMGVPISGPSAVYGDNMSVVHNTQRPESTLKKKSNSICYHFVREAVAMGECRIAHISTHENVADIATKLIPGGQKREHLVGKVLYDLTDHG